MRNRIGIDDLKAAFMEGKSESEDKERFNNFLSIVIGLNLLPRGFSEEAIEDARNRRSILYDWIVMDNNNKRKEGK
jgi:hypothetical protein